MRFYWLAIGILCVWRLTHLVVAEDGPWDLLARLRRAAGTGLWGKLLDCFACMSLWVAAPVAVLVGQSWLERILLWPALSGGGILLQRVVERISPAQYREDPEQTDVLLWQREREAEAERGRDPHGTSRPGLV